MQIGGLQKLTLIDYPGHLSATVFLCGCNFRCPWCYSGELVLPEKIKKQPKISEEFFFNFLKDRKGLLEGVTICGGEPTLNESLSEFCHRIKKLGYLIKLDTNGSNSKMLKKLIKEKLIDYVAMDIKAPKDRYSDFVKVNVDIEKIQESINILKEGKVDYEFRSTVLPKVHTKEDIINIAKWIRNGRVYYLQQFRPEKTLNPEYERYRPFSDEELELIGKECNKFVATKLRA